VIPPTPAVHPDKPTGASLAQLSFFASHPHGFSLCPGAYHFFDSTTFSASTANLEESVFEDVMTLVGYVWKQAH
jgi:hypothetical protein